MDQNCNVDDVVLDMTAAVLFYGHTLGLYAAFSNFFPAVLVLQPEDFTVLGVAVDGPLRFACSEQAFMFGKSPDPEYQKEVLATPSPYDVKKLGRTARLRPDWDDLKYAWMVVVLKAKFSQNPILRDLLLSTADRPIHENCKDPWWGGGPNFPKGRDLLGKALMEVRAWLRATMVAP